MSGILQNGAKTLGVRSILKPDGTGGERGPTCASLSPSHFVLASPPAPSGGNNRDGEFLTFGRL